jgi:hypothetical protein
MTKFRVMVLFFKKLQISLLYTLNDHTFLQIHIN